jgi:uncharacterized protein
VPNGVEPRAKTPSRGSRPCRARIPHAGGAVRSPGRTVKISLIRPRHPGLPNAVEEEKRVIAPPPTLDALRARREEILRLAEKYGVHDIRVFGSLVHGDARPESDVDLLVQMAAGRSLLDHVGFMQDLQDLLGRGVDVVEEGALHWYIRDRVLAEAVPL